MADTSEHITIIGAGLGGCLLTCALAKAGFRVSVYERRGDPRAAGFKGGRSINLAISARGIAALREVGLADAVLKAAIPMPGRMIHDRDGELHFQAYSKNPAHFINSVSRADLNMLLLESADAHPQVRFHFDHRCTAIDFQSASVERPVVTFERADGRNLSIESPRIIGADGAFSAVRLQMMLSMDRFEYSQQYLEHGYKELQIRSAGANQFAMHANALHIWPRGGSMMIALPNPDGSFTCTCFWPFAGPHGFDALRTDSEISRHFQHHYPDAVPLMPTLVEDFKHNPTSALVTIRCAPWHYADKALLIGDAAHAIVPFYGQGANAAFEDCSHLVRLIEQHGRDWKTIFRAFSESRKPNADAIADMAYDNFTEMRDHTSSPVFRARKKTEHGLHALMPGWFLPLYDMISFSTIPYAEARARARHQTAVILTVAAVILVAFIVVVVACIFTFV